MPLAQKGSERENSSSNKDKPKTQAFLRLDNPRTIITYRERQLIKNYNFIIMNLEKMNVSELNRNEMTEINGGGFFKWLFVALVIVYPILLVEVGIAAGIACFAGCVASGMAVD